MTHIVVHMDITVFVLTLIMSEKRDLTIKIQSMDGVHVKSIALLLESSWLLYYLLAKHPCPLGVAEYCEDDELMTIFPSLYNYVNKQTLLNICMNSFPVYSVENSWIMYVFKWH